MIYSFLNLDVISFVFSLSFGAKFKFQYIENGPFISRSLVGFANFSATNAYLEGMSIVTTFLSEDDSFTGNNP